MKWFRKSKLGIGLLTVIVVATAMIFSAVSVIRLQHRENLIDDRIAGIESRLVTPTPVQSNTASYFAPLPGVNAYMVSQLLCSINPGSLTVPKEACALSNFSTVNIHGSDSVIYHFRGGCPNLKVKSDMVLLWDRETDSIPSSWKRVETGIPETVLAGVCDAQYVSSLVFAKFCSLETLKCY